MGAPTTTHTGGRPTLAVIRATPPRAFGAGVVLDPEEAAKRPVPSTTPGAWNALEDHSAYQQTRAWITGAVERWHAEYVAKIASDSEWTFGYHTKQLAREERRLTRIAQDRRVTHPDEIRERVAAAIAYHQRELAKLVAMDGSDGLSRSLRPASDPAARTGIRPCRNATTGLSVDMGFAAHDRIVVQAQVIGADADLQAQVFRAIDAIVTDYEHRTTRPDLMLCD